MMSKPILWKKALAFVGIASAATAFVLMAAISTKSFRSQGPLAGGAVVVGADGENEQIEELGRRRLAYPLLQKTNTFPAGECQGGCEWDYECEGDLHCFRRVKSKPVPGCYGWGVQGLGYCYKPFVNTTTAYSHASTISIESPSADPNHLLVLSLARSDGFLPLEIGDGWKRAAECYKSWNRQWECMSASDCVSLSGDGKFCHWFENEGITAGHGKDLAQALFYKQANSSQTEHRIYVQGTKPAWAIMTALNGVDLTRPIRWVSKRSCDNDANSVFESVSGARDDILLLSQSFDDAYGLHRFGPPLATTLLGHIMGPDEAGYIYGRKLFSTEFTGEYRTTGFGGPECKDIEIAVTIRSAP